MLEHRFAFESFGVRVCIESNEEAAIQRVHAIADYALLGRLTTIDPMFAEHTMHIARVGETYSSGLDGEDFGDNPDLGSLLKYIGSRIRILVAEYAREIVFVHAGVVVWNGKAVVIPGTSHSGKTTLVAELVKKGAVYFSDEYALISADGMVHPFPRPLAIRERNDPLKRKDVEVGQLGGIAGSGPAPIGLVYFGKFRQKARWDPKTISPGVGLIEIITHTIPMRVNSEFAIVALRNAVEGAEMFRSDRGEAVAAAEKILQFIDNTDN